MARTFAKPDRSALWGPGLVGIFLLAIVAIYWPAMKYPFVANDWGVLEVISRNRTVDLLRYVFIPSSSLGDGPAWELWKLFYRPLGVSYLMALYQLFGFNALAYHALALLSHLGSSLLALSIIHRLTGDRLIAIAGGLLYAAAVTVHMEPILWMEGVYDIGGAILFLGALRLFLAGRSLLAALLFLAAIFFKEATVVLPLVLLAYLFFVERDAAPISLFLRRAAIRLWPFALVWGIYAAIKLTVLLTVDQQNQAYALSLFGEHIVYNLILYGLWTLEALLPPMLLHRALYLGCLLLFVVFAVLARRAWRAGHGESYRPLRPFLWIWLALAIAPVYFLPNISMKYYLTYALVPAITLFLLALKRILAYLRPDASLARRVLLGLAALNVVAASVYFYQRDAAGFFEKDALGINRLIKRGTVVNLVKDHLLTAYPQLPAGAVLVFDGGIETTYSFYWASGPRVWYQDDDINVYEAEFLSAENGQYYYESPIVPKQAVNLPADRTFFFSVQDGALDDRGWSALDGYLRNRSTQATENAFPGFEFSQLGAYVDSILP